MLKFIDNFVDEIRLSYVTLIWLLKSIECVDVPIDCLNCKSANLFCYSLNHLDEEVPDDFSLGHVLIIEFECVVFDFG